MSQEIAIQQNTTNDPYLESAKAFHLEMPPYHDLLVCGVSTQLHHYVKDFDEIIAPSDADFSLSGLLSVSVISLGFWLCYHAKILLAQLVQFRANGRSDY